MVRGQTLEERLPEFFEPDTMLPAQYFDLLRRRRSLEGEKLLVFTVLEDAIECYMKYVETSARKGQRLFKDAEEWIDTVDRQWFFSFDNVCEALDINPEYMRRGLHQWKERRLKAGQPKSRPGAPGETQAAQGADPETVAAGLSRRSRISVARPIWRRKRNPTSSQLTHFLPVHK
jgi:hypothetical protein